MKKPRGDREEKQKQGGVHLQIEAFIVAFGEDRRPPFELVLLDEDRETTAATALSSLSKSFLRRPEKQLPSSPSPFLHYGPEAKARRGPFSFSLPNMKAEPKKNKKLGSG